MMFEKIKKSKSWREIITYRLPALMMASVAGLIGFFKPVALLGSAWMTTGVFAGIAFAVGVFIQNKREAFKKYSYVGYVQNLEDQKPFGYQVAFEIGKQAALNTKALIFSCFDKNAIFYPGAYYAGMAERLKDEKIIAEYQLLSQDERNQRLYALANTKDVFAPKLKMASLRTAANLLAAGADPNFIPYLPEHQKRGSELGFAMSLLESAIFHADVPFVTLLLKYKTMLFRQNNEAINMLTESLSNALNPHHKDSAEIWNRLTHELGTTPQIFSRKLDDFAKSPDCSKHPYVFYIVAQHFEKIKLEKLDENKNHNGMKMH